MKTGNELRDSLIALQGEDNWTAKKIGPAPWRITALGREWSAATSGHSCVMVAESWPDAQAADTDNGRRFAGWFDGHEPVSVDIGALARFVQYGAGARDCVLCGNSRVEECDACDGSGEVECECDHGYAHEHDCTDCDGDGKVTCSGCSDFTETKPARLGSHVVNRQVLREALETLGVQDGAARLSVNGKSLFLLVPDVPEPSWMVVFMPLAPGSERNVDVDFAKPETWEKPVAA